MKNKSDLKGKVKNLLTDLKIAGINVKYIRCDSACDDMSMNNDQDIKSFGVKFKFSGLGTPEMNGKVEGKFQTFYGGIRFILNGACLKGDLRNKIWAECVITKTYLSNLLSTKSSFKSPFDSFFGGRYLENLEWLLLRTIST
jgi:hypothetical protein